MEKPNCLVLAIAALQHAKEEATQYLSDTPEYSSHRFIIDGRMTTLINMLSTSTGTTPVSSTKNVADLFPPITNFFGDEIALPTVIVPEDLTPKELEGERFVSAVNKLYAEFTTITPEGILNSYVLPEHQLILRGVAKKAGLSDYEEREINLSFVEEIGQSIIAKEKAVKDQEDINQRLAEETAKASKGKAGK
ncbi:hypothetical protein ACE38W_00530 [Chitinophaga sp. Hz27]|uniref:hypothetical protein n=1 Tax=Chitinophaga sp. Hz27 TaxID=3347169 RepID=UPI0035DA93F7